MINEFCWYLEHKSRRLIHFVRQMGIVGFLLLLEKYGVKILITSFWDTQYTNYAYTYRSTFIECASQITQKYGINRQYWQPYILWSKSWHLSWWLNFDFKLILRGYCTPDQFFDCLCIFLKNYKTLVTSKICFL